jgi:trehalose 6-phosphate phosphatase
MRHLLGREGRPALAAVLRARPLLAFDFDGTLAPIVKRPEDARVAVAVSDRLAKLVRLRPVAIITGRTVEDVAPRLGFEPQFIVGNHGAEDPVAAPTRPDAAAPALDTLRAKLAAEAVQLREAGVQIEDKNYSIALHYRLAKDRDAAQALIGKLLRGLDPALKTFGGKCVENVVATGAPDKADALASLVQRADAAAAIFIGDDINDEVVFARHDPQWLTVRIGRDDPLSQADFFLDSHAEIATVLQTMLDTLAQVRASRR